MWQYTNYSKINPKAKKHFPFKKPRVDQLETISEIIHAINKGYKYIILESGTGTGKSAIAYTLSSIYDSSYILTLTKQLQDQYINDFPNLKLVKGRNNFTCQQYKNKNCDEGKCIIEDYICENPQEKCNYYIQKNIALNSNKVISNYHYMFLELNYIRDFIKRQLLICDEAHNLENTLMHMLKLEFHIDDLKKYLKQDITDEILYQLDNGDYDVWLQFISEIKNQYQKEYDKIKDVKKHHLIEKILFIKNQINDCNNFLENIIYDPYSWIFNYDEDNEIIEFKPLKVDNYANRVLFQYADVCIFMSATILDYKFFCKCLGINENEIYQIRRKSPFDFNQNPVKTVKEYDLSHKNINENAVKTISVIKTILNNHKNQKGIIHTVSGQCKDFIMDNIDDNRLIEHNTDNRIDQLEKFKNSDEDLVLISPSMNEGVDLPGDLCEFQIIYKLPYPDLADKQILLRASADEDWYNYKTALSLIQTYGRGMRFENDSCVTYFIDSRIKEFVKTNKFIPESFKLICV